VQSFQQHLQQQSHVHPCSAHQPCQESSQQQLVVQQDRAAPLFTLSEYAQQRSSSKQQQEQPPDRNKLRTRGSHENPASMPGTLCVEADAGGRQRVYRLHSGVDKGSGKMWEGFDMVRMPVLVGTFVSCLAHIGSTAITSACLQNLWQLQIHLFCGSFCCRLMTLRLTMGASWRWCAATCCPRASLIASRLSTQPTWAGGVCSTSLGEP
jgi:hypothetical protein